MSEARFPWRTLLFASVALNLLVIGGVAGAWSAGVRLEREGDDRATVSRLPGPGAFLGALPPELRDSMREELTATWSGSREVRQAAVQARRDAFEAAAQEPYDAVRVRAAFERLRAADQAAIGVFQNSVIDGLAELTPEQRRETLQALRSAAPAMRRDGAGPAGERAERPALTPERREEIQERRQERRERWRERRQERLRQGEPQP
ncbi:MAG: periplasmic heavy metal sensor [Alphaproteobacteria bacterium]|nr:periplasmic heavy metal sensor [Alphaproteobacteria bacterium]